MAYDNTTLATFMSVELGATGRTLFGATPATSAEIVEAVNEVEAVLGAAIADLTDDLKTRAVARWQAWRTAKGAASGQFDVKAGTTSVTRSQFWTHINSMLADAERAVARYPDVAVVIGTGLPPPIPYAGGLSQSDRAARDANPDRVPPFFTRELHETG